MHPYLFQIGNFPLGTYGLMLAIGFFAGTALAKRQGKLDGIGGDFIPDLAITLLMAGIIGAKVVLITVEMINGRMTFSEIFSLGTLRAGGHIHGGIIFGAAAFFWKARKAKEPVPKPPRAALGAPGGTSQGRRDEHSGSTRFEPDAAGYRPPPQPEGTSPAGPSAASGPLAHEPHGPAGPSLRSIPADGVAARGGLGTGSTGHTVAQIGDALVPGVALGQAIGRLGCFAAGCCYGSVCSAPWSVTFSDPHAHELSGTPLGIPLHPVQLYTFLANLAVMGLLLLTRKSRRFIGQITALYFILEGVARLTVETWRGDLDRGAWLGLDWLSTGRLTAMAFVAFGIALWIWWSRATKAEVPE